MVLSIESLCVDTKSPLGNYYPLSWGQIPLARVHPQETSLLAMTLIECSDYLALEGFEGKEYRITYLHWSLSKGLCFRVVDLENGNLTCLIYLMFMVGISEIYSANWSAMFCLKFLLICVFIIKITPVYIYQCNLNEQIYFIFVYFGKIHINMNKSGGYIRNKPWQRKF